MGKDLFFINRLLEDIEVLENFYDVAIIADARLPLEFDKITEVYPDAVKIHIKRPELVSELNEKEQKHITETALDNYDEYDYKVINNSLEELNLIAKKIVEEK